MGPGPSAPSIGETKAGGQVLRAGHKRFFFDLGSNQKGDFLRITEVRLSFVWVTACLLQGQLTSLGGKCCPAAGGGK